jgi:hypothetical protein
MHMTSRLTRRRLIATASAFGLALAAACSTPAGAPPASGLDGDTTGGLVARTATVDLGRVPFDVQAEGRFELVNTGSRLVKLTAAPQVKMLEGC